MNREIRARRNVRAFSGFLFLIGTWSMIQFIPYFRESYYPVFGHFGLAVLYTATLVASAVYLRKLSVVATLAPFVASLVKTIAYVMSDSWGKVGTFAEPKYVGTNTGPMPRGVDLHPVASLIGTFMFTFILLVLGLIAYFEVRHLRSIRLNGASTNAPTNPRQDTNSV